MMNKKGKKIPKGIIFYKVSDLMKERRKKLGIKYNYEVEKKNAILDKKMGKLGISRVELKKVNESFKITCEEVQSNLTDYWHTPEELSTSMIGKISSHLKECIDCQGVFVKISESDD